MNYGARMKINFLFKYTDNAYTISLYCKSYFLAIFKFSKSIVSCNDNSLSDTKIMHPTAYKLQHTQISFEFFTSLQLLHPFFSYANFTCSKKNLSSNHNATIVRVSAHQMKMYTFTFTHTDNEEKNVCVSI